MTSRNHPDRLDELLEKLCEDGLDAAEEEDLARLLAEFPQNRTRYLEYLELHSALWQGPSTDRVKLPVALDRAYTMLGSAVSGVSDVASGDASPRDPLRPSAPAQRTQARPSPLLVRLYRRAAGTGFNGRRAITTAAAVIAVAVLIAIYYFGGSPRGSTVAWADVVTRAGQVDYAHVYYFKSRQGKLGLHFEGWYDRGRLVMRGSRGETNYDDGQVLQGFDARGMRTTRKPSLFADGGAFLEVFTGGLLSERNPQFNQQIPVSVSADFLIYSFDPLPRDRDFGDSVHITVGKDSLLPIQVRFSHKDGDYDLIVFDYQAPRKPVEFFEPPTAGLPNGQAEILLDADATSIDLQAAPGLKRAVVRLFAKYDGPADQFPSDYVQGDLLSADFARALSKDLRKTYERRGGPVFRLEVSFITAEGYRSATHQSIALWLNEAGQCGTGAEHGGLAGWPDGKYRNIRFSPLIRPTDRENVYVVEIRCALETEAQQ